MQTNNNRCSAWYCFKRLSIFIIFWLKIQRAVRRVAFIVKHIQVQIPVLPLTLSASQSTKWRQSLYQSAWTAIPTYHRLGSLNNGNLFSHPSGGWKFGEVSLPGLQTATFLLGPHMAFPLGMHRSLSLTSPLKSLPILLD